MASDYENVRLDSDAASTPHDEGSFFSSGHVHVHVHAREQLQRHLQLVAQRQVQARQKQKQKKKLPGNHLVVFAAAAAAIISLFTLQKLRGTPKPDQPALIVPLLINTTALACSALIPLALPLYHLCPALIGPPHDHGPQTLQASQILPERLLATLERDFEWIAFTAGDMQDQESDSCLVPVVNLTHSIVDDHYAAHAATECATRLHEANRVFKELRGDLVHPSVSFVDLAVGLRDMWNWVLLLGMVDEEQGDESFERASLMENWAEDMVRMRDDIERNAKMVAEVRQSLGGIQGLQTGVVVPYLMVLAGKDTWWNGDPEYYLDRLDRLHPHLTYFLYLLQISHTQLISALDTLSTASSYLTTLREDCFERLWDNRECIYRMGGVSHVTAALDRFIERMKAAVRWKDDEVRKFEAAGERETVLREGDKAPSWDREDEDGGWRWLYCKILYC